MSSTSTSAASWIERSRRGEGEEGRGEEGRGGLQGGEGRGGVERGVERERDGGRGGGEQPLLVGVGGGGERSRVAFLGVEARIARREETARVQYCSPLASPEGGEVVEGLEERRRWERSDSVRSWRRGSRPA